MKHGKSRRTTKRTTHKRWTDNIPSVPTITRYPQRSPWVARAEAVNTYSMAPKPRTVYKSTSTATPRMRSGFVPMWDLGRATPNKNSK